MNVWRPSDFPRWYLAAMIFESDGLVELIARLYAHTSIRISTTEIVFFPSEHDVST